MRRGFRLFIHTIKQYNRIARTRRHSARACSGRKSSPSRYFYRAPFHVARVVSWRRVAIRSNGRVRRVGLIPKAKAPSMEPGGFPMVEGGGHRTPDRGRPPLYFPTNFFRPNEGCQRMRVRPSGRVGMPRIRIRRERIRQRLYGMSRQCVRQLARRFLAQVQRGVRGSFQDCSRRTYGPQRGVMGSQPSGREPRRAPSTFAVGQDRLPFCQRRRNSYGRRGRECAQAGRKAMRNAPPLSFHSVNQELSQVRVGQVYQVTTCCDRRNCRAGRIRPRSIYFLDEVWD